jgi:hypothetical protein
MLFGEKGIAKILEVDAGKWLMMWKQMTIDIFRENDMGIRSSVPEKVMELRAC